MKNIEFILKFIFMIMLFSLSVTAQSGGTYQLEQTVTASGIASSGGSYSLENTVGQPIAGGFVQGAPYSLYGGFWTPPEFTPTAALVTIGGRVITSNGQGIRNAVVTLTDAGGAIRSVRTANFGYFSFEDVRVGETYILTISSKRFVFVNPTRVLNVTEEISDLDFISSN